MQLYRIRVGEVTIDLPYTPEVVELYNQSVDITLREYPNPMLSPEQYSAVWAVKETLIEWIRRAEIPFTKVLGHPVVLHEHLEKVDHNAH